MSIQWRRRMLRLTMAAIALTTTCGTVVVAASAALRLPNTTGIDGQLTANLGVDRFFSLWLVFNDEDVQMSDEPFTILAPKNAATSGYDDVDDDEESVVLHHQPERVKRLLFDHIVLGRLIDLANLTTTADDDDDDEEEVVKFRTLGGREVVVRRRAKESDAETAGEEEASKRRRPLEANGVVVAEPRVVVPNGLLIVLDGYLRFPRDGDGEAKETRAQFEPDGGGGNETLKAIDRQKEPSIAVTTAGNNASSIASSSMTSAASKSTFVENVLQVLSFLKSGVRVFQHFLSRSNVSHLLVEGEEYTVFVPTDHAFQRWHPIDWGFYPFSVPEFTESVIVNHFVRGRLRQEAIVNGMTAKTLGGRDIVFRKTATTLSVNGASIVKGNTPVTNGNIMFVGEVLFVSESVVSRLHQQHRDKETPPLLAFPWFGAQFLSHAFLALERDRRFAHVTRFLNLADLAPHVSGAGYTFFVPTDDAFERTNLDKMPDNYLSTGDGLQILLNHFVKGRLYDRDLIDGTQLMTLGGKTVDVTRRKEKVYVNEATIVESEVFVYNLGTMFYIDRILFADDESLPTAAQSRNASGVAAAAASTTTTTEATTTGGSATQHEENAKESSSSGRRQIDGAK